MNTLWAHKNTATGDRQLLEDHLRQVAASMQGQLTTVYFPLAENLSNRLEQVGLSHDLGKATIWFQQHLEDADVHDARSFHGMISAVMLAERIAPGDLIGFLEVVAVRCHHGSLSADTPDSGAGHWDYLEEQFENCRRQLAGHPLEHLLPTKLDPKAMEQFWRRSLKKARHAQSPEYFFLLQFLFSKLIAADKLDSAELSQLPQGELRGNVEAVLAQKRAGNPVDLNSSRERIRQTVLAQLEALSQEQLRQQRIFTITAPTGTGKTLTGLAAALLLAQRLTEEEGGTPHIIAAVPFINILEQTLDDYQAVFGDVLVHYGASDPAEWKVPGRKELPLKDQALLMSSWEAPVVLTTFVQLFESILTGKNNRLLKLNRLAGAIVILDEVQALRAEQYPLFSVVMDCAARYYGTRFILMTATQPKLFSCTDRLNYPVVQPMELLPDFSDYFHSLNRTMLVPKWKEISTLDELAEAAVAVSEQYDSVLCVVNKIQDSLDLYQQLTGAGKTVLYLSTNIISVDRKEVIAKAKHYLNVAFPFILVSTQTIEAGVDLDFDVAFRDLAPMESIIQVAGRVNRSGKKGVHSPVFLCDTGSSKIIYNSKACQLVRQTICQPVEETRYQEMMSDYFRQMLEKNITFETELYREGILNLDYEIIDQFAMIGKQERKSVLIVKDDHIEEKIEALCSLLRQPERGFDTRAEIQRGISQLGAYTVDVYVNKLKSNLPPRFRDCYDIDLDYFVASREDWSRYYSEETGFIADHPEAYLY